jgi:hypothetical protein
MEDQYRIAVDRVPDVALRLRIERLAEIEATDLGGEQGMQFAKLDGHGRSPNPNDCTTEHRERQRGISLVVFATSFCRSRYAILFTISKVFSRCQPRSSG